MHHEKCIAAAFFKLNSLRMGLGIICPNKRSYNDVVPGQMPAAVGQTLNNTRHFSLTQAKKKRNEMGNEEMK